MDEETREETPKTDVSKWLKINGVDKTEEDFCAWINGQVTDHPVVKLFHGKWKELIAWEAGDQFSQWDDQKSQVSPVHLELRKARIVVNFMKPLLETIDSKLNFSHSVIGTPNSGETKDIFGAQVATRLLAFNDEVNDMDSKLDILKYDVLRPGIGVLKWIWDKGKKGTIAPLEDGKPNRKKSAKEDGDVVCENVPIFNIRPDPTAKSVFELRWVIEIKEVTKDALLTAYPKAKGFLPEIENKVADDTKYVGMNVDLHELDPNEETLILKEFWEIPSLDYENGRKIVTCENKVLFAGENDSPDSELPYFFFFYKKTPYSLYCQGPLYYVQDLQRYTNRLISMAAEHVEAWKPKMTVGQGALKRANSMTLQSCELVEVDYSRGEPKPMAMPTLSPEVAALRDFLISAIGEVSNIHEVSQSRLPEYASRASGNLYAMMLEQENIKLDPMVRMTNSTFIAMDRFRLKLMDKHYKLPRLVKIVGTNRASSVAYYSKADLNGNYDVHLEKGVSLAQSSSTQVKLMMEMYAQGILTQTDKPKILKILHLGTGEFDLRDDVVDVEKAIRENQSFIDGNNEKAWDQGGVWFYGHDDHSTHLDFHTNLIKSEEASKWPKERLVALDQHIMMHFTVLAQISQMQGGQGAAPAQLTAPQVSASDTIEGGGGANEPNGQNPGPMPTVPGDQKVQTSGGSKVNPSM